MSVTSFLRDEPEWATMTAEEIATAINTQLVKDPEWDGILFYNELLVAQILEDAEYHWNGEKWEELPLTKWRINRPTE